MLTNSPSGLLIFTEALAKTLIHKGVFEKSELKHQLEDIRNGETVPQSGQTPVTTEIDALIARVDRL